MQPKLILLMLPVMLWTLAVAAQQGRFLRSNPVADEPVVEDTLTGLIWQGCSAGQQGLECDVGTAEPKIWSDALSWCQEGTWGGFDDWRLPGVVELSSIVDDRRHSPSIDPEAFPATEEQSFWTATTDTGNPVNAWIVYFSHGVVDSYAQKTEARLVRCVRGGS